MAIEAEKLVVLGAGGHGRAVAELAQLAGFRVTGFLDAKPPSAEVDGLRVWAEAEFGGAALPSAASALVLGIGANAARNLAATRYQAVLQPPLVHPRAIVSPSALLGAGTIVFPGGIVHTAARMGRACIVNSGAIVEHDCDLGAAVHVAPGAVLCGAVQVGEGTLVGAGAVVLPGLTLGAWVTVGAGAVVTQDLPDGVTVTGSPAREPGASR
ncbi:MAG: acetyltransferase [Gemmatimonadota bacterium]|nr:acetyltransferase [Gemmatimonadota bacterium]